MNSDSEINLLLRNKSAQGRKEETIPKKNLFSPRSEQGQRQDGHKSKSTTPTNELKVGIAKRKPQIIKPQEVIKHSKRPSRADIPNPGKPAPAERRISKKTKYSSNSPLLTSY